MGGCVMKQQQQPRKPLKNDCIYQLLNLKMSDRPGILMRPGDNDITTIQLVRLISYNEEFDQAMVELLPRINYSEEGLIKSEPDSTAILGKNDLIPFQTFIENNGCVSIKDIYLHSNLVYRRTGIMCDIFIEKEWRLCKIIWVTPRYMLVFCSSLNKTFQVPTMTRLISEPSMWENSVVLENLVLIDDDVKLVTTF
jgi:hypothetical protein